MLRIVCMSSTQAVRSGADSTSQRLALAGERVVRLTPNTRLASAIKQRLARLGQLPLATTVTTFSAWANERWDLFGDGRHMVNSIQRRALLLQVLKNTATSTVHSQGSGMQNYLSKILSSYGGTREIDPSGVDLEALAGALAARQRLCTVPLTPLSQLAYLGAAYDDVLALCMAYQEELDRRGLIEISGIYVRLARSMGGAGWSHLLLDGAGNLTLPQAQLVVEAARQQGATVILRADAPRASARTGAAVQDASCCENGCSGAANPANPANPANQTASSLVAVLEALASLAGVTCCVEEGACAPAAEDRPVTAAAQAAGAAASAGRAGSARSAWQAAGLSAGSTRAAIPELEALKQTIFRPHAGYAVRSTGALRCLLPMGNYARVELLAREIGRLLAEGVEAHEILVTDPAPLDLAQQLSGRLCDIARKLQDSTGTPCCLGCEASGLVAAHDTQMGRALNNLVLLHRAARSGSARSGTGAAGAAGVTSMPAAPATPELTACAHDLARLSWLDIPVETALQLDRKWRRSACSAQDFLRDLRSAAPELGKAIRALDADAGALAKVLDVFTQLSQRPGPGAAGAVERSAATSLAQVFEQAAELGLDSTDSCLDLMNRHWVPTDVLYRSDCPAGTFCPDKSHRDCAVIRIMGRSDAVGHEAHTLIVCGLNASGDSSSGSLPGAAGYISDLDLQRAEFYSLLEVARCAVVLERTLFDSRAQLERPSVLFEETVDCYRTDLTSFEDINRTTALPEPATDAAKGGCGPGAAAIKDSPLTSHVQAIPYTSLGEDDFPGLLSPLGALLNPAAPGALRAAQLLPRPREDRFSLHDSGIALEHVSPSDLETYWSCPARWFYERYLPSRELETGFDQRSKGNLYHAVLKAFYDSFPRLLGLHRIPASMAPCGQADPGSVEAGLDGLLDSVFDQQVSAYGLDQLDAVQRQELEAIRHNLHQCIRNDAAIPEDFAPAHTEWHFGGAKPGAEAAPEAQFSVGGVPLKGTVDRIDVNGAGQALIIDYKGSLGPGYKLAGDLTQVQHLQVLMYAQAIRSCVASAAEPVGALYVSYKEPKIYGCVDAGMPTGPGAAAAAAAGAGAGAAASAGTGAGSLVGAGIASDVDFGALLDQVQLIMEKTVTSMRAGEIKPRPRFGKDSCQYCLVTDCPGRCGSQEVG